ncbi:MAG: phosphohydrolase [Candidatus Dormibacteria bacterium]
MSNPLVLFHASCADGFCAAWLFHRRFPGAEFIAVQYGDEAPDVHGRDVYIVDFSFPRGVLLAMKEQAASLIVLDHHKTAQADLADLDFCTFDMSKSGGRLAWEYLNRVDWEPPWLVTYTEDRDLWLWKAPFSREINAALHSYKFDFGVWDGLDRLPSSALIVEGKAILRYQQGVVDGHVKNAKEIEIDGHKVLAVNATTMISEIAGELAKALCQRCDGDGKAHGADRPFESSGTGDYPGNCPVCRGIGHRPFGVCWFDTADRKRVYSLRSRDGGIDVSAVAKVHGGGGHKQAAGFSVRGPDPVQFLAELCPPSPAS